MYLETLIASMFVLLATMGRQDLKAELQQEFERYLLPNWTPQARMLWVISANATDIVRIGVHPKINEYALALIDSGERQSQQGVKLFLVTAQGVQPVSRSRALTEIARMDYQTLHDRVLRRDETVLATFVVEPRWIEQRMSGDVRFGTGTATTAHPSLDERKALRHIGTCLMVKAWGSLFAAPQAILLDGLPLDTTDTTQPQTALELVAA